MLYLGAFATMYNQSSFLCLCVSLFTVAPSLPLEQTCLTAQPIVRTSGRPCREDKSKVDSRDSLLDTVD